ncbi:hypothetical protein NSK_000418 [Nannochloropsis salina CCMP1776]|uniref:3-oxoacyl-[acyl-carrier-protein] reductase n=1 Tax=Nannochloropsis salina CCMP1776 TaxID=1027361 RepID=A0A4D9DAM8_9STRA|nr:hypothetical protein NSK_000418 [Nannochloropsis salina CCMP1776]|eukprot:TFJ88064.1 hypothetical protein NSK_000418 [Nannochloropsis salina CCMP1776]
MASHHLTTQEHARRKVAVVTGAAGTLGESITGMLLSEGYVVAALDIRAEGLSALKATLDKKSDQYHAFAVDISSAPAVEEVCRTILTRLGAVSVLINNAGLLSNHKCLQTSLTEWHRVMHVNVDGAFLLSQQLLPCMRSMHFGRIVNITSMAAKTGGVTAGTAYAVSKGALASLTFSLARETAGDGITVNGVAPAYVKTPMVMQQLREEQRVQVLNNIPVGRFCEPEEVAHTVRFLISPLAGFITGEIIDQNGGYHMD